MGEPVFRRPRYVMVAYRQYILGCKAKWGSARSLIHYREIIAEYLAAKREIHGR